jgi:hypothetical protein
MSSDRREAFAPRRAGGARQGFELWWAVIMLPAERAALRLRYSYLAPAPTIHESSQPQGVLWASCFDVRDAQEHRFQAAGFSERQRRFSPERVEFGDGAQISADRLNGEIRTLSGPLRWDLELEHRFAPYLHGGGVWPGRAASAAVSAFAGVSGRIASGRRSFSTEGASAFLGHAWGEERDLQLAWLWAPAFDSDGSDFGLEALTIRPRRFAPQFCYAAVREKDQLYLAQNRLRALGRRGRVEYPRLELELTAGPYQVRALATLNETQQSGYVQRRPVDGARYAVHSDISRVQCELRRKNVVRELDCKELCALEFQQAEPAAQVVYLNPYAP